MINQKYRRTVRWNNYDYSREGSYFITINTKEKYPYFGEIQNGVMCLSSAGQIIYSEWLNTLNVRKNISFGEFVVMPDHFHAIVFIDEQINDEKTEDSNIKEYKNLFGPQKNNLSSILRGFKGSCTKQIQAIGFSEFEWQPRFHDRVIRNYEELLKVEEYIMHNISRWQKPS